MNYTKVDMAAWDRRDLYTFYMTELKIVMNMTVKMDVTHALAFSRKDEKGELWVVANRGEIPVLLSLPRQASELLLGTHAAGGVCVTGNTVQIWRLDDVQARMGKVDEKQKSEQ